MNDKDKIKHQVKMKIYEILDVAKPNEVVTGFGCVTFLVAIPLSMYVFKSIFKASWLVSLGMPLGLGLVLGIALAAFFGHREDLKLDKGVRLFEKTFPEGSPIRPLAMDLLSDLKDPKRVGSPNFFIACNLWRELTGEELTMGETAPKWQPKNLPQFSEKSKLQRTRRNTPKKTAGNQLIPLEPEADDEPKS